MKNPAFSLPTPENLWRSPIAILGYGVEGKSTLAHLRRWGYQNIIVLDKTAPTEPLPEGIEGVFGPDYLNELERVHTAFRSPGLRPFVPEIEAFKKRSGTLTSQVEAAFRLTGKGRIIGVTGTVGKGTCCSLLSAMLTEAKIPHRLAGNIGLPPLDAIYGTSDGKPALSSDAYLLLELSSFQLSTLNESPALAVVLRTTSEHLDWHTSQNEYLDHKANLTCFQEPGDTCVYFSDVEGSRAIGLQGKGRKITVGVDPLNDVKLADTALDWVAEDLHLTLAETHMTGAFNLENVGAAAAAARVLGATPAAIRAGARKFSPLEHRIEFVREAQGVRYYNDSYATRPEATLAAAHALRNEPFGLILGGSEKNADFSEMAAVLAHEDNLRAVALIGETASRLEDELRRAGAIDGLETRAWKHCETLEAALDFLRDEVKTGAILLSPACASFGLFANYKERGYAFKRLVKALPG